MASQDVYLVIGGSGFVGRHIVQQLLDRGDVVSVFDIVQRHHDVPFYSGDISNQEQVSDALRKSAATCIIHTASPHANLKDPALYQRVNVDGTNAIIAAAQANGVRKLVFTSSAGVVFCGQDIIGVDERVPPPEIPFDAYNDSKAKAEVAVLAANGKGGLLTVALRPAGIFGEGDRQAMTGFYQVYERNQTHFQIGDNTNLFDWTYVGNVARAHLIAADKLVGPEDTIIVDSDADSMRTLTLDDEIILNYPLPSIDLTTGLHRIPTSEARPLGPYVTLPPNATELQAAFNSPRPHTYNRPIFRSKFDQFSSAARSQSISSHQVAGHAFFITNGEPIYFWDLPRAVWTLLDARLPTKRPNKKPIVLPKSVGLAAATAVEWWSWLVGKEPTFTRYKVSYSCTTRWHNIEKARRVLGYEPEVGIGEGVERMVNWWLEENGYGKMSS